MEFKGKAYYALKNWDRATIERQAREITELHYEAGKLEAKLREELSDARGKIGDLERDIEMLQQELDIIKELDMFKEIKALREERLKR